MTIRWRLALWYTAILVVILLLLGSSVFLLLDYTLTAEIERDISNKADKVLESTKVVGTLPFFLRQVVLPDVEVFSAPDVFLQVITAEGEIAVKSANLGTYNLPVTKKAVDRSLLGEENFVTFAVDKEEFRMIMKPIQVDRNIVGLLQVARPLKPVNQARDRLKGILIMGGAASLLLSLGFGWFIAGRALGPIKSLTKEARGIGLKQDLTNRVKYEGPLDELGELALTFNEMLRRLEEAYGKLESSLSAQKRFVADASHELRTPLTSIQGNVDFLLQFSKEKEGAERDALMDISSEIKRLNRLVNDLLIQAKADSGFIMDLQPVELLPILEDMVRKVRYIVRGQEWTWSFNEMENIIVLANTDYLKQMLYILLDNAFKYTPAGKKVFLNARVEGNNVRISVNDEGPGIPEKDIPHIFERFYRSEIARTGEGTGLGLSTAKWIAQQHHSEIELISVPGEGTTFSFHLSRLG